MLTPSKSSRRNIRKSSKAWWLSLRSKSKQSTRKLKMSASSGIAPAPKTNSEKSYFKGYRKRGSEKRRSSVNKQSSTGSNGNVVTCWRRTEMSRTTNKASNPSNITTDSIILHLIFTMHHQSNCQHLVAWQRTGKFVPSFESVLAGLAARSAIFTNFEVRSCGHRGREKLCFVDHDKCSFLTVNFNYFGNISQSSVCLLFPLQLFLDLFFLPLSQLSASLVQYLVNSCLFVSLNLFLQVLFSLSLFLFSSDDLWCLIQHFSLSWSSVRQLNEVLCLTFLSFGFVGGEIS